MLRIVIVVLAYVFELVDGVVSLWSNLGGLRAGILRVVEYSRLTGGLGTVSLNCL